jgi:hypothetical protein
MAGLLNWGWGALRAAAGGVSIEGGHHLMGRCGVLGERNIGHWTPKRVIAACWGDYRSLPDVHGPREVPVSILLGGGKEGGLEPEKRLFFTGMSIF